MVANDLENIIIKIKKVWSEKVEIKLRGVLKKRSDRSDIADYTLLQNLCLNENFQNSFSAHYVTN